MVEVSDSGTGMPPEVVERCFEPFFSTKDENGTGLGLPMVYSVMQHHGGEIRVKAFQKGTSFYCTIPLEPPVPSLETQPEKKDGMKGVAIANHVLREE